MYEVLLTDKVTKYSCNINALFKKIASTQSWYCALINQDWNGIFIPFSETKPFQNTIFVQLRNGQVEKILSHRKAPEIKCYNIFASLGFILKCKSKEIGKKSLM